MCIHARQISVVTAIFSKLLNHGDGMDVSVVFVHWKTDFTSPDTHDALRGLDDMASAVVFSLNLYIRFAGLTHIQGSVVGFEDVVEYMSVYLRTWKEAHRLNILWDIVEARLWKDVGKTAPVTNGWHHCTPSHKYILN